MEEVDDRADMFNRIRHFGAPEYLATPGGGVFRRPLPPEVSVQSPFLNDDDETLEAALCRLSLSGLGDDPYYALPSSNGGGRRGYGGEPLLRSPLSDYFGADQGSVTFPLPNGNGNGSVGNIGFEDCYEYPLMESSDLESYLSNLLLNGSFRNPIIDSGTNHFRDVLPYRTHVPRLAHFSGKIVTLAMDQNGCRYLQSLFNDITRDEIDMIFGEVIDHVAMLMVDTFGNYLFQKLVEFCCEEQRSQILFTILTPHWQLYKISFNVHGTRSVQKLLDHLTTLPQISLAMSVISCAALRLSKHNEGHHVIKHCLQTFPYESIKCLLHEVANNCFEIARDKHGCCVMQSCLEYSQAEYRERLVAEITSNALLLADERYGNYVVQYLLLMKIPRVVRGLLKQLKGNFIFLSCNKFSSNVVEKCLAESKKEEAEEIIIELLKSPNLSFLLLDPFGNYVIQTALSVSEGNVFNALRNLVRKHAASMRNNQYGRKVLSWLEKRKL